MGVEGWGGVGWDCVCANHYAINVNPITCSTVHKTNNGEISCTRSLGRSNKENDHWIILPGK